MSNNSIEQEIQAKHLTAPRITPQALQDNIVSAHYFTAANGVSATGGTIRSDDDGLRCLTFCVLVLKNGFTVTGESACASPENFDEEIGRKIARTNAEQKIWPLMGYWLKQCIYERSQIHSQEDAFEHYLTYSGSHGLPDDVKLKMWNAFVAAYPC